MAHVRQELRLRFHRGQRRALGLDEVQFLPFAVVDIEGDADQLVPLARALRSGLRAELQPTDLARGSHDACLREGPAGLGHVLGHRPAHVRLIVGMDDGPAIGGRFLVGQGPADEVDELLRAPELSRAIVDLEHAGAGHCQRQSEPGGVALRVLARLHQRQLLALALVEIQDQADHLDGIARRGLLQLGAGVHPPDVAGRQDDPELPPAGRHGGGAIGTGSIDRGQRIPHVVRVDHGPDARSFLEGQGPADDLGELRRTPERALHIIDLIGRHLRRARGEFQPLRIGAGLLAGFHQRGLLALATVNVHDQADDPAGLAARAAIDVGAAVHPAEVPAGRPDPQLRLSDRDALDHLGQQGGVLGVDHGPAAHRLFDGQGASDDLDEPLRAPEQAVLQIDFIDACAGGVGGQPDAFGPRLRLAAGRRDELAPFALVDVAQHADDAPRAAKPPALGLGEDLYPARPTWGQGAEFQLQAAISPGPVRDLGAHGLHVVRVGDRPDRVSGLAEAQRPAGDVHELRRTPEASPLEIDLESA